MRAFPFVLILAGLTAPVLPVGAQQIVVARGAMPAWLGVSYDLQWVQAGTGCQSQVIIDHVVPGSPADRAGLRPGDAILAVNGDAAAASRVQWLSARLAPGDSVRLVIGRGGSTRQVIAVAERRPDRPPMTAAAAARGPTVRVRGDTLVALNLDLASPAPRASARGYWLARDDGETVYRTLTSRPRAELDRRVASLLVCADTAGRTLAMPAWADVERIHERAESLRVVIASRALAARDFEGRSVQLYEAAARAAEAAEVMAELDNRGFLLFQSGETSFGPALVAGAEIVAMEPELAAYFQGASEGLLVVRVAPGTPAERGGLRPGDVITAAAGRAVLTPGALRTAVAGAGSAVDLAVVRQGRRRVVSLTNR